MVQQLRKSITTLAFFAISATAGAQAPSAPLTLHPDAPDRYVVVPGDTLWSISQRYTDSPWRWPELLDLNAWIQDGRLSMTWTRTTPTWSGCRARCNQAWPAHPQRGGGQRADPEYSRLSDRTVPESSIDCRTRRPR